MPMFKLFLACLAAAITAAAQDQSLAQSRQIVQKVCGVCHTPESVITNHRSRAQWQETIDKMVGLGAKGTAEEFSAVLDYLVSQFGPNTPTPGQPTSGRGAAPAQTGLTMGPDDKHVVDAAAADRARSVWAAEC